MVVRQTLFQRFTTKTTIIRQEHSFEQHVLKSIFLYSMFLQLVLTQRNMQTIIGIPFGDLCICMDS